MTSVWTRERRTAKSPTLSRAQIVRAAVEILDAEGMDALSMRRLGTKLGSGATSIYWHVASKDELLELVLDEVFGEVPLPDPDVIGWRDAVSAFAYGLRGALFAHPWSTVLIGAMPTLGPNAMRLSAGLLKTFKLAGFQGRALDQASSTLMSYVTGVTTPEIAWQSIITASGMSPQEIATDMMRMLQQAAGDYPELVTSYAEHEKLDDGVASALNFEFGLSCFLDGLEARLRQP